jgi:hypothetical protein
MENMSEDERIALKRAKDLVDLYYDVKVRHMRDSQPVIDQDLSKAREDVDRIAREMN